MQLKHFLITNCIDAFQLCSRFLIGRKDTASAAWTQNCSVYINDKRLYGMRFAGFPVSRSEGRTWFSTPSFAKGFLGFWQQKETYGFFV